MPLLLRPHPLIAIASVLLLAQAAVADQDHPTVRITTGAVKINGWEKSVLQGDPNLKNYHWHPYYANVQGTQQLQRGRDGTSGPSGPRASGGRKPSAGYAPSAPPGRKYLNPIHAPFVPHYQAPPPMPDVSQVSGNLSHKDANGNLSNRDVNGSLTQKKTDASLVNKSVAAEVVPKTPPPPPAVATYGDYSRTTSGATGRVERSDVYGKLKKHNKPKSTNKSNSINF